MTAVALIVHGWDLADRASVVSPALEWNTKYLYLAVPVGGVLSLFYLLRQRLFGERAPISGILSVLLGGVGYLVVSSRASVLFAGWSNEAILVGSGLLLMLLGVPIGFALALSSFLAFWTKGALFALTVPQNMATSADSFVLLAIPFFMVAGGLMTAGGSPNDSWGWRRRLLATYVEDSAR
jgi:C4-dicarboxylate transporter DctM subunit